jgi:hypothetical protein
MTTLETILSVYFGVNLMLAMMSAVINYEQDKTSSDGGALRFVLYIAFGVPLFVFSLIVLIVTMIKNKKNKGENNYGK